MANFIDGTRSGLPSTRTLDISGESYGYIVSHDYYGLYDYSKDSTKTLKLTNLMSSRVNITFEEFAVHSQTPCSDYIEITTQQRICTAPPAPLSIDLGNNNREITFTFHSDSKDVRKGFWLLYEGGYCYAVCYRKSGVFARRWFLTVTSFNLIIYKKPNFQLAIIQFVEQLLGHTIANY